MLVLLSDLHLTDTPERSTFQVTSFERTMLAMLEEPGSRAAEGVRLVLLGDVFEVLKSRVWLDAGTRPWEAPTELHRATVGKIVDRILAANSDFFAALGRIRDAHPRVAVTYVIGNHDWPLNTAMGTGSRVKVRTRLGLAGGDALFPEAHDDPDHELLAQHGHHWDLANRYRGGAIAIGDAIVIDVVMQLPLVFARHLGVDPDDPLLRFVHELDDVIPQTMYSMAEWLAHGLVDLEETAGAHLDAALEEVVEGLTARVAGYRTESPVDAFWVSALKHLALTYGPVRLALTLPAGASAPPSLARHAGVDLEDAHRLHGVDYRYIVYGHTHIPDFRSLSTSRGVAYYLNSGTWRRLHRAVDTTVGPAGRLYATTIAHSFIIVRHPRERSGGLPGYELRQSYHD
ncbi:MAG TPA: hypothetical protein VEK57_23690 [Thermoanaerobaculia bacterium]|nr:hypothetical protein [Thermoanaerobaculia bacterium]